MSKIRARDMWPLAIILAYCGAYLDDYLHSHWWALLTLAGVLVAFISRGSRDEE
jgi:hypothetical protein